MASAEVAITAGEHVRRFWRWWTGELRSCVPASIVHWISRLRVLPLVVPGENEFSIHRFDGSTWRRSGGASGDTAESAVKMLGAELRKANIKRFALALTSGQYLTKLIHLPQVAEDNLRNALRYELDRHTPFKPDDVGFDCCVVGRDDAAREIAAQLVIAPKATIAHAVASVAGLGVLVAAVQPAFPERASLLLNLLPHEDNGSSAIERIKRWGPWAFLAGLVLAALVLPVYQKRAQVIELQPQVNIAGQQAQVADQLHQQLERAQTEYNFLLQKRYGAPTALQLLAEVSRILPDDTWLQNFELRTTSKGKEVQLQGETGVAGKMIELFEQSPLLTGASFKSPVTQAPGSQGSRFHLGMDVKEGVPPAAPPPPVVATAAGATASATTPRAAAPASNAPSASPVQSAPPARTAVSGTEKK
ncbi:MAG: PilN domain-containing protein [Betaproteobacteria bacterium]